MFTRKTNRKEVLLTLGRSDGRACGLAERADRKLSKCEFVPDPVSRFPWYILEL